MLYVIFCYLYNINFILYSNINTMYSYILYIFTADNSPVLYSYYTCMYVCISFDSWVFKSSDFLQNALEFNNALILLTNYRREFHTTTTLQICSKQNWDFSTQITIHVTFLRKAVLQIKYMKIRLHWKPTLFESYSRMKEMEYKEKRNTYWLTRYPIRMYPQITMRYRWNIF